MTAADVRVPYRPLPPLTTTFVAQKLRVSWKDLAWAQTNAWLDTKSLAELADNLAMRDDDQRVAMALAAAGADHAALALVLDGQASGDQTSDATIRDRWMHLAVSWLYLHRRESADPWVAIEDVWEAFGHAEPLNGLIRWMPTPEGGEPGEEGVLNRWRAYAEDW